MLLFNCVITAFCSIILIEITTANSKFQTFSKSNRSGIRLEPMKPRLNGYSIIMCGAECEKTENCVSYSYHATMELCEINRYNPNDVLATAYNSSGWEIFTKYEEKCWPTDDYGGFVRDGICYFWAFGELPWANARADCQDKGADLVCIDSEAENQALINHVPSKYMYWWIGLNDLDRDGVFTCKGNEAPFSNWQPNYSRKTPCAEIYNLSWNTWDCDDHGPYVCEKQLYTCI